MFGVAAPTAHASLSVPSTMFTGSTSSASSASAALAAFEASAGGADNGTTPGEQGAGFRHLNWDGIALDGSDPGSTVISAGHVVALARSRAQPWGLELGPAVAVANDGFASVNSHAGFAPFSAPDEWAPFNSNTSTLQVVAPAGQPGAPVPALTRGLGMAFVNVKNAGTTIQYYSGDVPLLAQPLQVPTGDTAFAGVLFRDPVVSRVVVTLGTATLFDFGASGPVGTDPTTLAAADDVALAEPGAGQPTISATAGAPIATTLATFDSSDAAGDIRAAIDWGDGTRSSAAIVAASGGGFSVTGTHAYAQPGTYTATVTVDDFAGSELVTQALVQVAPRPTVTNLACSPSSVAVSAGTTCTATVADGAGAGASAPTGLVSFSSTTPGAAFAQDSGCLLGPTASPGVSSCAVAFTPGLLPPVVAHVAAAYPGDGAHGASNGAAAVAVHAQRCSLRALTRRLRAQGLGVLVTCDARTGVQLSVQARVGRKGRFRAFEIRFGTLRSSVTAARPTVLVVKPAAGVLPALRAAVHRHQHVSLKLTLTASSHATTRTTTTRVSALRLS